LLVSASRAAQGGCGPSRIERRGAGACDRATGRREHRSGGTTTKTLTGTGRGAARSAGASGARIVETVARGWLADAGGDARRVVAGRGWIDARSSALSHVVRHRA